MSNPLRRKIELECGYILALRPASSQFKHDIIDEAAGKSMTQDVWIGSDCPRLEIPCQDVNFREIKDMKRRSKHFGGMQKFTSIAAIETLPG